MVGIPGAVLNAGLTSVTRPLSQCREILEVLFEHMSEPVVLYDRDLLIVGINRAAANVLSMDAVAAVGKSCRELFRCAPCERGCVLRTRLAWDHKSSAGGIRVPIHKQGQFIEILPFYGPDRDFAGLVALVRDALQRESESSKGDLSWEEHEKRLLARALEAADGNVSRAARLLQISRDTLRYRMKRLRLRRSVSPAAR